MVAEPNRYSYFAVKPIKMKLILFSVLSMLSISAYAQDVKGISVIDGQIMFDKVFESAGKTKQELFSLTKIWFVNEFKDAQEVIQYSDVEEGKIIGKGSTVCGNFVMGVKILMRMTITVLVKDSKYRVLIGNISFQTPPTQYHANGVSYSAEELLLPENFYKKNGQPKGGVHENYRECVEFQVKQIFYSFQQMGEKPLVPANEDW